MDNEKQIDYWVKSAEFTLEKFNQIKEKFIWLQKKLKS